MANVKLSSRELDLVCDAGIILTKNNIIAKVYELMGQLSEMYIEELKTYSDVAITATPPKISRGENYEGLPWVMLDYPRYFKAEDHFAIRTFFWWGHFLGISLLVKGKFMAELQWEKLDAAMMKDWYLCCSTDAWQHHFRPDNYMLYSSFQKGQINNLPFIKLAKKIPVAEFEQASAYLQEAFLQIQEIIKKASN
jgi:hypothetical protein